MNSLFDLIRRFFISPIWERTGYNWVNTLTYGLILGIAAVVTYRSIRKTGYRFNLDLFVMFLPFLVLATTIRALVDSGKYPYTYLLISPGIYFTTMGIFGGSILFALAVKRLSGTGVRSTVVSVGTIFAASQLVLLLEMVERPLAGAFIITVALGVCGATLVFRHVLRGKISLLDSQANLLVICCHLIDATVTYIGIDFYGYAEQHVLPRTLIGLFGTGAVMYLLKLAALPVVLYLLDTYVDDEEMNVFVKMVIMVLGLAPATRNFLRIIVGS